MSIRPVDWLHGFVGWELAPSSSIEPTTSSRQDGQLPHPCHARQNPSAPRQERSLRSSQVVIALADRCPARAVALRALYRQLCFAWLTGNGDVHAKNLSIVATPAGEWRIAPAYDLPSTVPYGDYTLALTMLGKRRGLSRKTLLGFAAAVGLPDRVARRVLDDLLDRLAGLEDTLRDGALPFTRNVVLDLCRELPVPTKTGYGLTPGG